MILLQETKRYRAETEEEAIEIIQRFKDEAGEKGYELKKSGYTQKTKKQKGEIVELFYWIDVTIVYSQEI